MSPDFCLVWAIKKAHASDKKAQPPDNKKGAAAWPRLRFYLYIQSIKFSGVNAPRSGHLFCEWNEDDRGN
jgi:hypothetical protein